MLRSRAPKRPPR